MGLPPLWLQRTDVDYGPALLFFTQQRLSDIAVSLGPVAAALLGLAPAGAEDRKRRDGQFRDGRGWRLKATHEHAAVRRACAARARGGEARPRSVLAKARADREIRRVAAERAARSLKLRRA